MSHLIFSLFFYISLVVIIYYFSKKTSRFQTKTSWQKSGVSLFVVNFSITTPLVYSGLIHNEGLSSLWLFWCGYAVSGFLPFVFAPLWAKLDFVTDNQFVLFRFSGKGAKVLHIFRTIYVGWIIVAFIMSFQLLALLKTVLFFTGWNREIILGIMAILLILIGLKNKLHANIQLDFFNTILVSMVFIGILVFFFLLEPTNVTKESIELSSIFPENKLNLWILFFIQTWSVNLFDGSGIDAQRFFATKNKKNTWKVAALSALLSMIFAIIFLLINYIGCHKLGIPKLEDQEMNILFYLQNGLPKWFLPFVIVAFFAVFLTSFEGLLNWGASFLTIDGYKTYLQKETNSKQLSIISLLSILIIITTSLSITYFSENLTGLIKLLFSISAGVAPVFTLRWFWMRINAWSQLSGMLSSGIYTMLYQSYFKNGILEKYIQNSTSLNQYSIQLIIITLLTSITWIIVTIFTKKDNSTSLKQFKNIVFSHYNLKKQLFKAFVFGIIMIATLYLSLCLIELLFSQS